MHGKTWAVKGQTSFVSVPGQRQSISAASAVNSNGGFCSVLYHGSLTGERFIDGIKGKYPNDLIPLYGATLADFISNPYGKHNLPGRRSDQQGGDNGSQLRRRRD